MIDLAADHSPALATLAEDPALGLGYVKVGEWLEATAPEALAAFPAQAALYHHNSLFQGREGDTARAASSLRRWHELAHSPWLSAHLDCYADDAYRALFRQGEPLPAYDAEEAVAILCKAVRAIQAQIPVPLLLENVDPLVPLETCAAPLPGFIARVLEATGCGLLLDVAHARVTAAAMGCDVHGYLEQLPLARVVEVHVSGPRMVQGRLRDVHEALLAEDYDLLEWVLGRAAPRVVTLEYSREPGPLREQLLRLRGLGNNDT